MKWIIMPLMVLAALCGWSQENILQQEIGINLRDQPVKEAIRQLENTLEIKLTYPSSLLPVSETKVSLKKEELLGNALRTIFQNKKIDLRVVGKRIHIVEDRDTSIRKFRFHGYLRDAETGETLVGATVQVTGLANTGAITNAYGFFSLLLPEGPHKIQCSYLGYESYENTITLNSDQQLSIRLKPSQNELTEVVVWGNASDDLDRQVRMGVHELNVPQWKKLPAFAGEPDLLKMIQLLPGVKSAGEGSTGFFVRGGNLDQNLILLDEAPIYNPSHLLGFFSAFNPDAIRHTTFFKGGFPVEYGGRLSSVVDLRMREGNRNKPGIEGGIGTLANRLLIDGPIGKEASFMVAARRTYPDLLLAFMNDNGGNKLHFYDLNGKANWRVNDRDHLFLSLYFGRDIFRFFDKYENTWGNATATMRWNRLFSPDLFANFSLIFSRYNYFIDNFIEGQTTFNWQTSVTDFNAKADFSWYPGEKNQVKFGFQSILHEINPGSETDSRLPSALNNKALETTLYAGQDLELSPRFSLAYGARMILYNNLGSANIYQFGETGELLDSTSVSGLYHTTLDVAPRLTLSYQANPKTSLKASYGRTIQHQQELRNSSSPFSAFYIWVATQPNIPVQRADQVSLGLYKTQKEKGWEFSLETYYRWLYNQVDFVDHARLLQNPYLEQEMRFGKGRAYGVEMLLRKTKGKLTGMLNYTYSRTLRKIAGINEGKEYPAYFDLPHELGITLQYQLSKRWSLAGNWQYSTGKAVNLPIGSFLYDNTVVPIYAGRNASRLEDYHRLDISATLGRKPRPDLRNDSYWVFSIQNVYYRKNALSVDILPYRTNTGNVPDPTDVAAYKTYLFGILPSVSYNFKF